jgi:hypothetical protein
MFGVVVAFGVAVLRIVRVVRAAAGGADAVLPLGVAAVRIGGVDGVVGLIPGGVPDWVILPAASSLCHRVLLGLLAIGRSSDCPGRPGSFGVRDEGVRVGASS